MSQAPLFIQLSKEAQQLADIALASQQSSSFYEDMSWYRTLHRELKVALKDAVRAVDEVLDFLQQKGEMIAYERFLSMVETASIYTQTEYQGQCYDGLSLLIPISAWSRFNVVQPEITAKDVQFLEQALRRSVLTAESKVFIYPQWLRCGQVDTSFSQVHRTTASLVDAALDPSKASAVDIRPFPMHEDTFHSDSLVLMVGVAVPAGQEMFRWQRGPEPLSLRRDEILKAWQRQVAPLLAERFVACHVETLLPDAFYAAMSDADKQVQVGALSWHLQRLLDRFPSLSINDVVATVAMCRYGGQYEVRIGFMRNAQVDQPDEGMLWYLHGPEQNVEYEMVDLAQGSPLMTIAAILERLGVVQVNICRRVARVFDWEEEDLLEYPNAMGRLRPLNDAEESPVGTQFH